MEEERDAEELPPEDEAEEARKFFQQYAEDLRAMLAKLAKLLN